MNPKLFFVLLLICAAMTNALAQQFLVLEKMGTKKRFEYYPGEEITFKTPDEDYFTRGGIRGFGDSLIILSDRSVHIKSIVALNIKDHKDRTFVSRLGPYLMVAGSLRDFGPMWRAERRAREGKLLADTAMPLSDFDADAPRDGSDMLKCAKLQTNIPSTTNVDVSECEKAFGKTEAQMDKDDWYDLKLGSDEIRHQSYYPNMADYYHPATTPITTLNKCL